MAYATPTGNLLDKHMRFSIYDYLHATVMRESGSMRIDELCFKAGRQEGRCDIVVVNSLLHCYEIKSDGDSCGMKRLLTTQVDLYSKLMDRLSVVVTMKYVDTVHKKLPSTWGIYAYHASGEIEAVRQPEANDKVEPRTVAGLLWKESATQLLSDFGLSRGLSRKAKDYLHDFIIEQIDYEHIHEAVRRQLKSHRRSL